MRLLSKMLINFSLYSFLRRKIHLPKIGCVCASFLFKYTSWVRFTLRLYDIGPAIYCNNLQSLHIYNTRTQTHKHTYKWSIYTVIQYTQMYIIILYLLFYRLLWEWGLSFIRADSNIIYVVRGMCVCVFYAYIIIAIVYTVINRRTGKMIIFKLATVVPMSTCIDIVRIVCMKCYIGMCVPVVSVYYNNNIYKL